MAIDKMERASAAEMRQTDTHVSHLRPGPCDIHRKSTFRETTFSLEPTAMQMLKHTVLSLNFGNHKKLYRTALRRVLLKVDIIRSRAPSTFHRERNERLLVLVLPDVPENNVRRLTILGIFNGEWLGKLSVHASPGETDEAIHVRLQGAGINALFGAGPGGFPSSKFAHCEDAPRWVAIQELVGCFSEAYLHFAHLLDTTVLCSEPTTAAENPADAAVAIMDDDILPPDGVDDGGDADGVSNNVDADCIPGVAASSDPDMNAFLQKTRDQHRYRQTGCKWARSGNVLFDCWSFCMVIGPHVELMKKSMFMAGDEWDRQELINEARACSPSQDNTQGNGDASGWTPTRDYRLPLAYDGKYEEKTIFDTIDLMTSEAHWDALPPKSRTAANRTKAFLMLNRSASLFNKVKSLNSNYPNKLVAYVLGVRRV
jgi:hypothetical protein